MIIGMTIVVSWATQLSQTKWSVGFCSRCDSMEAIRCGNTLEVVSVFDIPLSRRVVGKASCCDWCEYQTRRAPEARLIPLTDWSYGEGLRTLFEKCAPDLCPRIPQRSTDDELHTILKWITRRSSINYVDIGNGFVFGALFGAVSGLFVSMSVEKPSGFDSTQMGMLTLAAGGVIGCILASAVEGVRKGRQAARKMVLAAYQKYDLAAEKLVELANAYPRRVRSAVEFAVSSNLK